MAKLSSDSFSLHRGVENGDLQKVRFLLNNEAIDVNCLDNEGFTPLHRASKLGHAEIVKELLQHPKIGVNERSEGGGNTAILLATKYKHLPVVKLLSTHSASGINFKNKAGLTALHHAVKYDYLAGVKTLLEAETIDVNSRDGSDCTPLYCAVDSGNQPITVALLKHKNCDSNSIRKSRDPDTCGTLYEHPRNLDTPLNKAIVKKYEKIIYSLLEHAVDVNLVTREASFSSLHLAAAYGSLETITMLLGHKTDISAVDSEGNTPLHVAAKLGNYKLVTLLLANAATVDLVNGDGNTPLHLVTRYRYDENKMSLSSADNNIEYRAANSRALQVVQKLLEKNAHANCVNNEGNTPLHHACQHKDLEMVRILLDAKASPNAINKNNHTPLFIAVERQNTPIVVLLLDNKAEFDGTVWAENGYTNLHRAVIKGDKERVSEELSKATTDVNSRNHHDFSALHLAALYERKEIVKEILDNGNVEIDLITSRDRDTALHIAVKRNNKEIAQLLLRKGANVNLTNAKEATPLSLTGNCADPGMQDLLSRYCTAQHSLPDDNHPRDRDPLLSLSQQAASYNCDEADGSPVSGDPPITQSSMKQLISACFPYLSRKATAD